MPSFSGGCEELTAETESRSGLFEEGILTHQEREWDRIAARPDRRLDQAGRTDMDPTSTGPESQMQGIRTGQSRTRRSHRAQPPGTDCRGDNRGEPIDPERLREQASDQPPEGGSEDDEHDGSFQNNRDMKQVDVLTDRHPPGEHSPEGLT